MKREANLIVKSQIGRRIFHALLGVSLIPLLFLLIYISSVYYENLKTVTIERNSIAQNQSAETLAMFLQNTEFVTNECYDATVQQIMKKTVGSLVEQVENQNTLMKQFNVKMDLFHIIDKLDSITILTKDETLYTIKRGDNQAENASLENFEQMSNYAAELLVNRYKHQKYYHTEDGKIIYIRRINDTLNNTYLGLIIITFDIDKIAKIFPLYRDNSDNHLLIMSDDGTVLYSDLGLTSSAVQQYRSLESDRETYLSNTININKDEVTISLLVNQKELLKPVEKLRAITILLMLFTSLTVIVISNIFAKGLVKPLLKIKSGIDKIAEGDYSYKLNITSTDELGAVGKAFETMSGKIDTLINEVYATELSEKEAIIASLTAQINPHFLYNTLDMVKSMAEIEGNDDISEVVKALSVLFRYSTKTDKLIVSVQEEIDNLSNYMKIIEARFGSKIKFIIVCPEEVMQYQIIKLSLQPLVENSVQHGLRQRNNAGTIVISIHRDGSFLKVFEQDNGLGMEQSAFEKLQKDLREGTIIQSKKYGGVGMRNINERIKLYYGEQYGLQCTNYPGNGMRVEMVIPLLEEN